MAVNAYSMEADEDECGIQFSDSALIKKIVEGGSKGVPVSVTLSSALSTGQPLLIDVISSRGKKSTSKRAQGKDFFAAADMSVFSERAFLLLQQLRTVRNDFFEVRLNGAEVRRAYAFVPDELFTGLDFEKSKFANVSSIEAAGRPDLFIYAGLQSIALAPRAALFERSEICRIQWKGFHHSLLEFMVSPDFVSHWQRNALTGASFRQIPVLS
jgi:hypothetical protein